MNDEQGQTELKILNIPQLQSSVIYLQYFEQFRDEEFLWMIIGDGE